jgi:hypothetical protein
MIGFTEELEELFRKYGVDIQLCPKTEEKFEKALLLKPDDSENTVAMRLLIWNESTGDIAETYYKALFVFESLFMEHGLIKEGEYPKFLKDLIIYFNTKEIE